MEQFNEIKIDSVNFFKESTYIDSKGEKRICYQMTKLETLLQYLKGLF